MDQGSHASRAALYDERGRLHHQVVVPVTTHRPQPDWVEHDPEEIVASVATAANRVCARAQSITAAGLAVQRSSVVCWDTRSGATLSPVISWQDRRARRRVATLQQHADQIHALTGLVLNAHYGAAKLRWCLERLPAVATAARAGRLAFGPLASFLVFRLVQERPLLVDPANAARTLLWNPRRGDWDDDLLRLFRIPRAPLPRSVPTVHAYGRLSLDRHNPPLAVVTGDQSAALFAGGEPDTANAYINLGTGAFVQRPLAGPAAPHPRLLTEVAFRDARGALYVREGTVNGAAAALEWAAVTLALDPQRMVTQLDRWLAQTPAPPLFLNGISGLGSPYWIARFPSRFVGSGDARAKIAAVVESIVFLLAENLALMREDGPLRRLIATGGLSNYDGLCQRLADVSGLPLTRPAVAEATARGVAYLAAGRPAAWEPSDGKLLEPATNPDLDTRYQRWRTAMNRALERRGTRSRARQPAH